MTETYPLLREAYAVIDGIPKDQFSLRTWSNGKKPSCGMIGCGGGWLASYPPFIEQGLRMRGGQPYYKGKYAFAALAEFFGITYADADLIFTAHSTRSRFSDKEVWKMRVKRFLESHGGI